MRSSHILPPWWSQLFQEQQSLPDATQNVRALIRIKYTTAYIVLYHKTLQAKCIIQLLPLYFQSSGKFKTIDISLKFLSAIPDISKPIIIKTQYPNISVIDSYDGVQDTRELKFQCNPTELQAKVRLIRDICGNATIDYTCPVYEYIKYKNK